MPENSGQILVPERQLCSSLSTGPLTSLTVIQYTLTRFGHNPYMETMVSVRAALKELYVLKHIIAM